MNRKRQIREKFRNEVFSRDSYTCQMCGATGVEINAHHITDRNLLPNGGYVKENGITLCDVKDGCHEQAEFFHSHGMAIVDYGPDDLYRKIGSSYEKALAASMKL